MAQRQNSYARRAQQDIREAREGAKRYECAERDRIAAENVAAGNTPSDRVAARRAARANAFDALQVGDSLEPFGLAAVVAKKNAKSVRTTLGVTWTRKQLGAE